jgi:hypothetical protein
VCYYHQIFLDIPENFTKKIKSEVERIMEARDAINITIELPSIQIEWY